MPPTITVIGSANIDLVMQTPQLPAHGETVTGCTFLQAFGGKGANQAVAAARAGAHVHMVAALGADGYADAMLAAWQADGIQTDAVTIEQQVPTGSALIMVDANGENYITVAPGANAYLTPARVEAAAALIANSDWLVLQQEIPFEASQKVLQLATQHDTPVMLNYAPATDLSLQPGPAIHALIVNEVEAAALADTTLDSSDTQAAMQLADKLRQAGGHRFVVITLGKSGAVVADHTSIAHVDAFPVEATDTTAAGDTFCGALAVALGEDLPLAEAVRFASAASAISVTRVGAQTSIPTRQEIETFMSNHR